MEKIPFSPPFIDQSVIDEVVSCLNSGWITSGPKVKSLEREIAEYTGVQNVVCVNSWTSGAIMTLKWLGLKKGDEVIIPAYSYCSTALAVIHNNAKPVMIDVDESFVITVDAIRKAITPRTKAIIPVDIAGWPCDYQAIMESVNEKKFLKMYLPETEIQKKIGRVMIIGDCAHSFGAMLNDKNVASIPDISIFSLHAVKNLTTAEGGAICLNLPAPFDNKELYSFFKIMSLNGQTKDALSKIKAGDWKYDIIMPGLKINMPDICAAIGLAQIRQYGTILGERRRIYNLYSKLLGEFSWAQLPPQDNQFKTSSYHIYALRIHGINEEQRDNITVALANRGIAVNVHFMPMPMFTLFRQMGYKIENYPVSYDNYSREISLPIYPQLTNESIYFIVDELKAMYQMILSIQA